ncbi:hypothetical protein BSLA_01r3427 [Burkholderia stabilis]|nr:hypothetical protein BSLA_01r3427 [Burkholderia stabilis]
MSAARPVASRPAPRGDFLRGGILGAALRFLENGAAVHLFRESSPCSST